MIDINLIFNENFEVINELLVSELKRYLRQHFRIQLFSQRLLSNIDSNNLPYMEDVKLVLTHEELEKIPSKIFKELSTEIKIKCDNCSVCRDEFRENDTIKLLNCEHIFHADCISNWLTQYSYKCPCCRSETGKYTPNI